MEKNIQDMLNTKKENNKLQIEDDHIIKEQPKKQDEKIQNDNNFPEEGIKIDNMDMVFEEDFDEENEKIQEEDENQDVIIENDNYKSDMDTFNSGYKEDEEEIIIPEYITNTYNYHKDSVVTVKCNRVYSNIMASGGTDDFLYVTNLKDNKEIYSEKFKESVSLLDFSYDGSLLASYCIDGLISVYKNDKDKEIFTKCFDLETPYDEITVN